MSLLRPGGVEGAMGWGRIGGVLQIKSQVSTGTDVQEVQVVQVKKTHPSSRPLHIHSFRFRFLAG